MAKHEVNDIKRTFDTDLQSIKTISDASLIHIKYLGRKGLINQAFTQLKEIAADEKKDHGGKVNKLKLYIEDELTKKEKEVLQNSSMQNIDVTLPGRKPKKGSLHIVTYAIEEIARIFSRLGFIRMSYGEVEWEYYAFEALNMPASHPARDDFETFFIDEPEHPKYGKMVLTPHTSNGQIHEMLRVKKPPIKMINIARTYRPNWDASHTPMFHQFEGLCVDKEINLTHLKGSIEYFAKDFFGEDREIRLRPFHFQFTEPSFEVDITCGVCNGTGNVVLNDSGRVEGESKDPPETNQKTVKCKLCKSGWLELGGAGMVHPNVLKAGGIDPDKYSGWAFGFGIERVMMMKEGLKLNDIRVLYSGDVRFLEQF